MGTSSTKQAYGEAWYWDNRYSQDPGPFDWYQKYPALSPLLDLYLLRYNRVLLVGCGNSGKSQIPHLQFPILSSPEISILINCERGVKVKVNSLFNFDASQEHIIQLGFCCWRAFSRSFALYLFYWDSKFGDLQGGRGTDFGFSGLGSRGR